MLIIPTGKIRIWPKILCKLACLSALRASSNLPIDKTQLGYSIKEPSFFLTGKMNGDMWNHKPSPKFAVLPSSPSATMPQTLPTL